MELNWDSLGLELGLVEYICGSFDVIVHVVFNVIFGLSELLKAPCNSKTPG